MITGPRKTGHHHIINIINTSDMFGSEKEKGRSNVHGNY